MGETIMTNNAIEFDEVFFDHTYKVFYKEIEALLTETEQLLRNINIKNPDLEELHAIAHAIPLIKEIAAMFYSVELEAIDMTEITYISDDLLSQIGHNEVAITAEHVTALLSVKDLLQTEVSKHRAQYINHRSISPISCH